MDPCRNTEHWGQAMKLVIVGGVAGGASAAARARRLSEEAEIVVFERGADVSFANCGLPYYVGGEISPRGKLLVTRRVRVRELDTGREYEESYDALLLAPGAAPLRPPIPGIDLPSVLTLRNLVDVDRIKARVDAGARRVVVVGAGFIGLELAENFVKRGVETVLVELQSQVLPPLDPEMTVPIVEILQSRGVRVMLGDSAEAFAADGSGGEAEVWRNTDGRFRDSRGWRATGEQSRQRGRACRRSAWRHSGKRIDADE